MGFWRRVCIYGGVSRKEQIANFTEGATVVICTPGRLNDLVEADVINLVHVSYLVLDEADRMLDMGFEPQICKILVHLRSDRQTVMTTATWAMGMTRLAKKYMVDPVQVTVGTMDLRAAETVRQIVEVVYQDDKFANVG